MEEPEFIGIAVTIAVIVVTLGIYGEYLSDPLNKTSNLQLTTNPNIKKINYTYVYFANQPEIQFRLYNQNTTDICSGKVMFVINSSFNDLTTCLTMKQMFSIVQKSLLENLTKTYEKRSLTEVKQ